MKCEDLHYIIKKSELNYLRYAEIAITTIGCMSCHRSLRTSGLAHNDCCAFVGLCEGIFSCGSEGDGHRNQKNEIFNHLQI